MPHDALHPHYSQQAVSQSEAVTDAQTRPQGLAQIPRSASDLALLGDLTGRYAAGSYSKLDRDGRVVLRDERQGLAEHGHRITAALACHVARVGGTVGQLTGLLMHPDHEGGRHVQNIVLRSGYKRAFDYILRVWESASAAVNSTENVGSRQDAYEDLVALRERIEVTPWRGERGRTALRVLRAHLNFAESAGGRLHTASERQTAEEAGISRQALRNAYDTVLRPSGWLRRLRVGRGREGSSWYLGNGPESGTRTRLSRGLTTQFPPSPELEEWSAPETGFSADVDSSVIGLLMAHDAFAHGALGSSALMIVGALYVQPGQTAVELVITSSVSRATVYRALHRLVSHGLVLDNGGTWTLAARVLESLGNRLPQPVTDPLDTSGDQWDTVARQYGTAGTAAHRKTVHAAERARYLKVLDKTAEHRTKAAVLVRDGRQVLVPAVRPDEVPAAWHTPGGRVLDPTTGRSAPGWHVATDSRLLLITPADQRSYDELAAAHAEALREWESAA